jgi:hypothetical protein
MKRFTRMLSATLALATVCAASFIPASASTNNAGFFGNSKASGIDKAETYLPITSTYSIPKIGLLPEAEFVYTLAPDTTVTASTTTDVGHAVKSGSELFANGLSTKWTVPSDYRDGTDKPLELTKSDLQISFSTLPKDAKTGIYRFTLEETVNSKMNEKGEYDTAENAEYRVDLYVQGAVEAVEADEAKGIEAVDGCDAYIYLIKVYKHLVTKDDDGQVTSDKWVKAEPVFNNKITAAEDLIIKNYVVDSVSGMDVGFDITLQVLPGSDEDAGVTLKADTDLHAYIKKANGDIVQCQGQTVDGRTYSKIVVNKDENDVNTFTLYSGEELVVPGVPINMVYTTTNADANKEGFVSTYNTAIGTKADGITDKVEPLDRSAEGGFVTAVTTVDGKETPATVVDQDIEGEDNNTVIRMGENMIIYNNVNQAVSDTGVTMDTAPYIVMFIAAAGLAVLSLAKKKINR